jgi:hypothetical protein
MSSGAGGITPAFAAFASHAVTQQAEATSASSPVVATTAPEVRGVRPVRLRAQRSEPAFLAAARQAAQAATVSAPVPPPASTDPPANSASAAAAAAADAATVPSSPDKVPSVASAAPTPSVVAAPSVSERRGAARLSPPRDLRASAAPPPGDEHSRLNASALVREAYQRSLEEQLAAHGIDYTVHVTQNGSYVYKIRILNGGRVRDLTAPLNARVFRGLDVHQNFDGDLFDMCATRWRRSRIDARAAESHAAPSSPYRYWRYTTTEGALLSDDTLLPSAGAALHATLRVHLPSHLGSDDGGSDGAASALAE